MIKLISSKRKISYLTIALQPLIVDSETKAYDYCVFFHFHQVRGPQLRNMVPYTSLVHEEPKVGPYRDRGMQGGSRLK